MTQNKIDSKLIKIDQSRSEIAMSSKNLLYLGLFYFLVFGAAEYFCSKDTHVLGIIIYLLALFGLIINGTLTGNKDQRVFWLALGIVPIVRIISIAMPVMLQFSQFMWYIIIAVPIFVCVVSMTGYFKYGLADVGLTWNYPLVQILVGISGAGLAIIDYLILKPEPLINSLTLEIIIFPAIVLIIFTGFIDELVFRGVIQRAAKDIVPSGWILVSAIYAVTQISYGSVFHCILSFLISLYFGWVVKKTGSIAGVSICHGLINCGVFLIFPHLLY
jgi:uncharacterized protein